MSSLVSRLADTNTVVKHSFVASIDSDEATEIERNAEGHEHYSLNDDRLYYPVCIGDKFDKERYEIVHKLGFGGFSTVWLAWDSRDEKHVALKILIPPKTFEEDERHTQRKIIQEVPDKSRLLTYLSTFTLKGANSSQYPVLVLPLCGPNLPSHMSTVSMRDRMTAAKSLLIALENLHQGGFVHRDLSSRNIMWGLKPDTDREPDLVSKVLGRPHVVSIPVQTFKDGHLVAPVTFPADLLSDTVYIGDFGLTIKNGNLVKHKWQSPAIYCSPERFHNQNPSFASDIWSYMCVFSELYMGFNPADAKMGFLVHVFGPLPEKWKGLYTAGKDNDEWYNQDANRVERLSLKAMIERGNKEANLEERELVFKFMMKGFCYEPRCRLTAMELLRDPLLDHLIHRYSS